MNLSKSKKKRNCLDVTNMNIKGKKLIFILGHGRSGTSLLNKVLSSHPNIGFISSEFNDLPFFYNNWELYKKRGPTGFLMFTKDLLFYLNLKSKFHSQVSFFRRKFVNFREFMICFFNMFIPKEEVDYIGVKIASNFYKNVNLIKNFFSDSYCIHIIRDPRDVFLSLKKTHFGTFSPYYAGLSWNKAIINIQSLENNVKYYYEIKYENLLNNPRKELIKLCKFLQLPFSKKMIDFHEKITKTDKYHKLLVQGFVISNLDKWKKELTNDQLKLIYSSVGRKIYELGYLNKISKNKISNFTRYKEFSKDKILLIYNWFKGARFLEDRRNLYKVIILLKRRFLQ